MSADSAKRDLAALHKICRGSAHDARLLYEEGDDLGDVGLGEVAEKKRLVPGRFYFDLDRRIGGIHELHCAACREQHGAGRGAHRPHGGERRVGNVERRNEDRRGPYAGARVEAVVPCAAHAYCATFFWGPGMRAGLQGVRDGRSAPHLGLDLRLQPDDLEGQLYRAVETGVDHVDGGLGGRARAEGAACRYGARS
jgi:hypothetical protein